MSRKKKQRNIDYSAVDMHKLTNRSPRTFKRDLEKICNMYNLNFEDFKSTTELETSTYFFPPDTAQLLILLMKVLDDNPLNRKNAAQSDLSIRDFKKYNDAIIDYIESTEDFPETFKKAIYASKYYYPSDLITGWAKVLVDEILIYVVGIVNSKHNNLGATLRTFAKNMSKLNYNLYYAEYYTDLLCKNNAEELSKLYNEKVDIKDVIADNNDNVFLDKAIAELLNDCNREARLVRNKDFPEYNPYSRYMTGERSDLLKAMGYRMKEDANIDSLDIEQQRHLYFDHEWPSEQFEGAYRKHKEEVEAEKEKRDEWIEKYSIDPFKRLQGEDQIMFLENMIISYEQEIELLRKKIDEIKNTSPEKIKEDNEKFFEAYEKYRKQNLEASKISVSSANLYGIVDNAFSRLLAIFSKNTNM